MKKIVFVFMLMQVGCISYSHSLINYSGDTIPGRYRNYYYLEWSDQCEAYERGGWIDSCFYEGYWMNGYGYTIAKYEYTPQPLKIRGLVALVDISSGHSYHTHPERLPEYLYLYKMADISDTLVTYQAKWFHLDVLDSVRWDTAAPRYLTIDQGIGSPRESRYCYAYEAYFNKPVIVDSVFYIAGTANSNDKRPTEEDPWYVYHYRPTYYVNIEPSVGATQWFGSAEDCTLEYPNTNPPWPYACTPIVEYRTLRELTFQDSLIPASEKWWTENSWPRRYSYGLFLPIVYHIEILGLSADSTMGIVRGGGYIPEEHTASLMAIPNPGYRFSHWDDGSTVNPRQVQALVDTSYTAYFDSTHFYNLELSVNNEEWGRVTGDGVYGEGSEITVRAIPYQNCYFCYWSDNEWASTRTVTLTGDTMLTAFFAFDSSVLRIPELRRVEFGISPNPVSHNLRVTTDSDETFQAEVYGDKGQQLQNTVLRGPEATLDVSTLPAGHYILRLRSQSTYGIRSFIKK